VHEADPEICIGVTGFCSAREPRDRLVEGALGIVRVAQQLPQGKLRTRVAGIGQRAQLACSSIVITCSKGFERAGDVGLCEGDCREQDSAENRRSDMLESTTER